MNTNEFKLRFCDQHGLYVPASDYDTLRKQLVDARSNITDKVLAAIDSVPSARIADTGVYVSRETIKADIRAAVERVFVECGVEVKKLGDGGDNERAGE